MSSLETYPQPQPDNELDPDTNFDVAFGGTWSHILQPCFMGNLTDGQPFFEKANDLDEQMPFLNNLMGKYMDIFANASETDMISDPSAYFPFKHELVEKLDENHQQTKTVEQATVVEATKVTKVANSSPPYYIRAAQLFPLKVVSSIYGCLHDFGDLKAAQDTMNIIMFNGAAFLSTAQGTPFRVTNAQDILPSVRGGAQLQPEDATWAQIVEFLSIDALAKNNQGAEQ